MLGLIGYRDIATAGCLISGEKRLKRSIKLEIIRFGCGRSRVTNRGNNNVPRCLENNTPRVLRFMHQIHEENLDADVIVGKKIVKLKELLPYAWDENI